MKYMDFEQPFIPDVVLRPECGLEIDRNSPTIELIKGGSGEVNFGIRRQMLSAGESVTEIGLFSDRLAEAPIDLTGGQVFDLMAEMTGAYGRNSGNTINEMSRLMMANSIVNKTVLRSSALRGVTSSSLRGLDVLADAIESSDRYGINVDTLDLYHPNIVRRPRLKYLMSQIEDRDSLAQFIEVFETAGRSGGRFLAGVNRKHVKRRPDLESAKDYVAEVFQASGDRIRHDALRAYAESLFTILELEYEANNGMTETVEVAVPKLGSEYQKMVAESRIHIPSRPFNVEASSPELPEKTQVTFTPNVKTKIRPLIRWTTAGGQRQFDSTFFAEIDSRKPDEEIYTSAIMGQVILAQLIGSSKSTGIKAPRALSKILKSSEPGFALVHANYVLSKQGDTSRTIRLLETAEY